MREGGLPIAYFNSSGGWLGRLLEGSLKAISKEENYENFLRNNEQLIPKSSGSQDIILVLIDLTEDIHRLVTMHSLHQKDNPIEYLNEYATNWKDDLPFPLETETAQDLLTNLILESTREVKAYQNNSSQLEKQSDWNQYIFLKRTINITKNNNCITTEAQINGFSELKLSDDNLSQINIDNVSINFYLQSNDSMIDNQLLVNKQGYIVYNRKVIKLKNTNPLKLKEGHWCHGIYMMIETPTNTPVKLTNQHHISINPYQNSSMYAIDDTIPFLADIVLDNNEQFIAEYVGSYSQSTKNEYALIYIPDSYKIDNENNNSDIKCIGKFLAGQLYLIAHEVNVVPIQDNNEYVKYCFKTRCQDAHYSYEIRGRQLIDFIYPNITMKAGFKIYRIHKDSLINLEVSRDLIFIKPIHATYYQKLSGIKNDLIGVYHLLVKSEQGSIVFQQTIGILPENFSYKLIPQSADAELSRGKLVFTGINLKQIISMQPDVSIEGLENASEFILYTKALIIGKLNLILCTTAHADINRSLRLHCYFPSSQTLIYDANQNILAKETILSINSPLEGYRIKIFNANQDRRMYVHFYLKSNSEIKISYPLYLKSNQFLELRPYEWKNIIHTLMSYNHKGLDDIVIVEYGSNLVEGFKLSFSYYTYNLDFNINNTAIELKVHKNLSQSLNFDNPELRELCNKIQMVAVNFSKPDIPIILDNIEYQWLLSQLDELSNNKVDDSYQQPWLVSAQTKVNIDDISNTELNCLYIRARAYIPQSILEKQLSFGERQTAIISNLTEMAVDITHDGWKYLKQLTEMLIYQPLITLNQWEFSRFVPNFMVTVAIFGDSLLGKEIYQKFMTEIGFHWELLNFQHFLMIWSKYEEYLKIKLAQVFQGDELNSYFNKTIKNKKIQLSEIPVFNTYFNLIEPSSQPIKKEMIEWCLDAKFEEMVKNKLSQDIRWNEPDGLGNIIQRIYDEIDDDISLSIKLVTYKYMQTTAYLPLVLAWLNLQNDVKSIRVCQSLIYQSVAIYQIKQFEPNWFNEAFYLALHWFYHNSK